jgi:hypothetical protein
VTLAHRTLKVFLSYAHADDALKAEFDTHSGALKHANTIAIWSDSGVSPGSRWESEIVKQLDDADIVVMLVSPAFLSSEFIQTKELPHVMDRYDSGQVIVIPIIVRECAWKSTALSVIQALPDGGSPIYGRSKARRDSAWTRVVEHIHGVAEKLANEPMVAAAPDLVEPEQYLVARASQHSAFLGSPLVPPDRTIGDYEEIASLRLKLLHGVLLDNPKLLTVRGTLFPCALLTSGWWERQVGEGSARNDVYLPDPVQSWLFKGFDLWAPSWDFTWVLDTQGDGNGPGRFVAQLGTGDEADSLPVFIPPLRAIKLREYFQEGWGGLEAEVTGLLGHRRHFKEHFKEIDSFGGLLDYCLWIDGEDDSNHQGILPRQQPTSLYSGYLWKCLAPRNIVEANAVRSLRDVYFVWDHTNFASPDAVNYSLDALLHKEAYIRKQHGDLVLLQKSSALVPGECRFSTQQAFDIITGKARGDKI